MLLEGPGKQNLIVTAFVNVQAEFVLPADLSISDASCARVDYVVGLEA